MDRELRQFTADPREIDRYLGPPTLKESGTGTHFILLPASELLAEDIEGDPTDDKAPPLKKALLGFTNTLSIDRTCSVIRMAFRDHKSEATCDDLIAPPLASPWSRAPAFRASPDRQAHSARSRFVACGQSLCAPSRLRQRRRPRSIPASPGIRWSSNPNTLLRSCFIPAVGFDCLRSSRVGRILCCSEGAGGLGALT